MPPPKFFVKFWNTDKYLYPKAFRLHFNNCLCILEQATKHTRNRGHLLCGKSTAVYRKRTTNTVAYPPRNSKGTRDVHEDIPYAEVAHSRIELLFQE